MNFNFFSFLFNYSFRFHFLFRIIASAIPYFFLLIRLFFLNHGSQCKCYCLFAFILISLCIHLCSYLISATIHCDFSFASLPLQFLIVASDHCSFASFISSIVRSLSFMFYLSHVLKCNCSLPLFTQSYHCYCLSI